MHCCAAWQQGLQRCYRFAACNKKTWLLSGKWVWHSTKSFPHLPMWLVLSQEEQQSSTQAKATRRALFPIVKRAQRCGQCKHCLNPSMHQACLVRRAHMKQLALNAVQAVA